MSDRSQPDQSGQPEQPRPAASTPLDPMRLIHWVSGAPLSSALPITDPTPDPGLFGPDSVTWRLHREQWLIAAGARAFLLQAAHPVVAQGALDHSRFAQDPYGRVANTVRAMSVLIFGTTREAQAAARRINRLHQTVIGTLAEDVGRHLAGTAYSAMDPPALLWVHAAFVDSIVSAYQCFVGPLAPGDCEDYWRESLRYARLLGLSDADLPPSYQALQTYMAEAIASGEVCVGAGAHTIARAILDPPMPWYRRPLWALVQSMTIGQLPATLRRQYGLRWTWREVLLYRCVRSAARLLRFLLPHYLGQSQAASFAQRRVRGGLAAPGGPGVGAVAGSPPFVEPYAMDAVDAPASPTTGDAADASASRSQR
jgi:uncharacterized protein (DUF2236 family)